MPPAPLFVVPLDARPVCYDQVLAGAAIAGVSVLLPPREALGYLKQPASFPALEAWWRATLAEHPTSPVILSLDTLAYGGLIAGRVNSDDLKTLESRVAAFLGLLKASNRPRYAFSSILRIPNYDNAEEEPDYYAAYGRHLYEFSVQTHQKGSMPDHLFNVIPGAVIQDFLGRREKNFNLNKFFLSQLERKSLDFLTYCQDDTGPYGLNVMEATQLAAFIKKSREHFKAHVQTGADEVALTMLARALWAQASQPLKVYTWFFPEQGRKTLARFDGIPVGDVVQRQLKSMGALNCLTPEDADLILMIYAPSEKMGDLMAYEPGTKDAEQQAHLLAALQTWLPQKPVALADVVSANGADDALVVACLDNNLPLDGLAGYAAWNTPGNSIGTALAMGALTCWGQKQGMLDDTARRRLLLTRFTDDWAYQALVRAELRQQGSECPPVADLQARMQPKIDRLKQALRLPELSPVVSFPCERLFEIAVTL